MKVGDKIRHKEKVLDELGWNGVVKKVGKNGYWVDVNKNPNASEQIRWLDEQECILKLGAE